MKITISEHSLRVLVLKSMKLSSGKKLLDSDPVEYITVEGQSVKLKEMIWTPESEETRPFAVVPENWEHPKNLPEFMMQPVHDLLLSSMRLYRILQNTGISKIWHLVVCYDELLQIKGFGKVYFAEISKILSRLPGYDDTIKHHLYGRAIAWATYEHLQFAGDILRLVSILYKDPESSQIMDKHIFSETQAFVF